MMRASHLLPFTAAASGGCTVISSSIPRTRSAGAQVHGARAATAAQMREATAIFKSFDSNKDGVIDSAELHARMSDFGWTDIEIMSIVADMDTDRDGKVTLQEFAAAYLDFL